LVVPGLFDALPRRLSPEFAWPRPPALERLLARAAPTRRPPTTVAELLFELYALPIPSDADLPSAALCRLADGFAADDACWMHADPVHLKPDRDRLLLFDGRHMELSREQAEQLAQQLGSFYRGEGWRLQVAAPERWYLQLPRTPKLRTRPVEQAVGRNLEPFLPAGPEGGPWRSRLNEVQMLLHHSEVNLEREQQGLPSINGLWFWGAGRLPTGSGRAPFTAVYTDQLLTRGLALWQGIPAHDRPSGLDQLLATQPGGEVLVLLDDLQLPLLDAEPVAWRAALEALELAWFAPLSRALGRRLGWLCLYPGQGWRYVCGPGSLRRFWRRPRPLESYCREG